VLLQQTLAIVHGCLAQAFFALLCVIAHAAAPAAARPLPAAAREPAVRWLALAAFGMVGVQIVFGALLTHAGWLQLHLAGAVAVYALVPAATARLRHTGDPVATPVAGALLAVLGLQLLLGAATLIARFAPAALPPAMLLALPVAHRVVGSLIIGASAILAARVWGIVAASNVTADHSAPRDRARAVPAQSSPSRLEQPVSISPPTMLATSRTPRP
jgi:heme a synthase